MDSTSYPVGALALGTVSATVTAVWGFGLGRRSILSRSSFSISLNGEVELALGQTFRAFPSFLSEKTRLRSQWKKYHCIKH